MDKWLIKTPKHDRGQNVPNRTTNENYNNGLVTSIQIHSQTYDIVFYVDKMCTNEEKYTFLKN